ncbi:cyclic nucleotide-gated ion channel-like [Haematobia irritans]|uniref:cyclic nucleotide-gated ion channel-like n=1 Tax=Haematobia irritans TaxID=7368 RepID=UPI003F505455
MKLSVSAYRAHASAHKKILSSGYHSQLNYGSTGAAASSSTASTSGLYAIEASGPIPFPQTMKNPIECNNSDSDVISPTGTSSSGHDQIRIDNKRRSKRRDDDQNSNAHSSDSKSPSQRSPSSSSTTFSHTMGNKCPSSDRKQNKESSLTALNTKGPKHYTERDRLTLSDHSSLDYTNRRHVTLLLNSPSSEILNSIANSATSNSLKCHHPEGSTDQPPGILRRGSGTATANSNGTSPNQNQKWKSVRAVMAYYCSLRRIKRTRSNQRWMKLRTTVQISSAMQKKPPLKREDSFLKRFSTRQIPEAQETVEDTGSESASGDADKTIKRRRRYLQKRRSVVNPDENFHFYWLMVLTICVLYNLWTLIVRQSFPELQQAVPTFWFICDTLTDVVFVFDILVQLRTGYLEQGLMVYDDKKLACHYVHSRNFVLDMVSLVPFDLLQLRMGPQPLLRFTRFFKVYRSVRFYYIVESRTVWPNLWRVVNLIHILLILAHWFGCFYYLLSEAEGFQGDWVYPYRPGDYATLTRKYLGSLYWSTLTLTTIGDLPTPETNAEYVILSGPRSIPRRGIKSRLLQFGSSYGYVFTIVSYLIGVFIFATIVGQVGNVITNRNANRLEFERLLDGAKTYMRHHKVPGGMKRRVLRWYDYSWSRGRIQGGGDINTALGLLPDKLKTELALHVNLSVLKKVTIFQECQPEFLHDLVLKMKAYIFTPGDSICRKGEVAREMFIIADGILEVLSETGKVLTTMKAGDFFGEIGILNLDGLNKRTADVRSVGYSELFSLSREDVLAAMKDYPEAQEILQTLGRKRLMEVRCVNKKHAKAKADKDAANHHHHHSHHVNHSDSSENSASKKMVDKLRHDVKGFRSVLKKSRTSRRSDESLEMQPLHNTSPKNGKSMLKRMSRVRSDEKEETTDVKAELHDKTPSPIGAGLPLLQRLRLLKEKQDREERAVKSTPPQKSPPNSHVTCTLSPQESIQEEPEREINEGLPLIQRLQQLKIKNDPPPMVQGKEVSSLPITSVVEISNKPENISIASTSNVANMPSTLAVAQIKPMMKVSFRQRIQKLQGVAEGSSESTKVQSSTTTTEIMPSNGSAKKEPPTSLPITKCGEVETEGVNKRKTDGSKKSHKAISSISSQILKPSIATPSVVSDTDTPIKPWSKLKLATMISSSYTSLATSNTSSDDVFSPLKNYSDGNIPQQVSKEGRPLKGSKPPPVPARKRPQHPDVTVTRTSENAKHISRNGNGGNGATSDTTMGNSKLYQSVFDLSPEYSGLPFVKRLKILNERQKLAELESALQTRSFSLDSSKTTIPISEALYRCHSDTAGINSQFMSIYESSSTTSTNTSASETPKCVPIHYQQHHRLDTVHHDYAPLSPESNETLERRKLKSILKKISHEREQRRSLATIDPHLNHRGLSMEPTVEGPPGSAHEDTAVSEQPLPSPSLTPTTPASAFYGESVMSPPDILRAESIATYTAANASQTFQMNSSSTLTMYPSNLYPLTETNHSTCQIPSPSQKGVSQGPDCFQQILCGIDNVIRTHVNEMHSKFESQFSSMAIEVQRRDALIAHLQSKVRSLELNASSTSRRKTHREKISGTGASSSAVKDDSPSDANAEDDSSSGSSAELLFMRGDSLDTVFTSSPPTQSRKHYTCSPSISRSREDFSYDYSPYGKSGSSSNSKNKSNKNSMAADITGNLTRLGDSVVLDIGESSSSSSLSSEKLDLHEEAEDGDEEIEGNKDNSGPQMRHNDWEVRMLAAEMEKQERKRGLSLSDHSQLSNTKLGATFLRRRRKLSETETECSETEAEHITSQTRPRASSLDQFNLRYGIGRGGIFKAMSIDRDKDKL